MSLSHLWNRPVLFSVLTLLGILISILMVVQLGFWSLLVVVLIWLPPLFVLSRSMARLDKAASFYRQLFEETSDAIFVIQDGAMHNPNPATVQISGYSREELEGMDYSEIVAPSDRLLVRQNHRKRISGELPPQANYRFRLLCKDGSLRWVQLRVNRIIWKNKPAVVCLLTDVDEAHRQEQRRKDTRRLEAVMEVSSELARDTRQWLTLMKDESFKLLEAEHEEERLMAWRQLKELFGSVQNTLTLLERIACLDDYKPSLVNMEELLSTYCMQRVNQRSGADIQLLFKVRDASVFADAAQLQLIVLFVLDELLGKPGEQVHIQVHVSREKLDEATLDAFQLLHHPYLKVVLSLKDDGILPKRKPVRGRKLMFSTMQALAVRNGGMLLEEQETKQRSFQLYLPPSRAVQE